MNIIKTKRKHPNVHVFTVKCTSCKNKPYKKQETKAGYVYLLPNVASLDGVILAGRPNLRERQQRFVYGGTTTPEVLACQKRFP